LETRSVEADRGITATIAHASTRIVHGSPPDEDRFEIVPVAIAFAVAFGIGHLTGMSSEGPLMIVAGPLCMALDLVYRLKRADRRWFSPGVGGALFFIPVWILGIIWLLLGIVYTVQGHS
jgi:hypothetical protein